MNVTEEKTDLVKDFNRQYLHIASAPYTITFCTIILCSEDRLVIDSDLPECPLCLAVENENSGARP